MVQKVRSRFTALPRLRGGVGDFVQVFEARVGFGRMLLLQHASIARAFFDQLQCFVQRNLVHGVA